MSDPSSQLVQTCVQPNRGMLANAICRKSQGSAERSLTAFLNADCKQVNPPKHLLWYTVAYYTTSKGYIGEIEGA